MVEGIYVFRVREELVIYWSKMQSSDEKMNATCDFEAEIFYFTTYKQQT